MGGAGHLIRSIAIAEQAKLQGLSVIFCGHIRGGFAESALSARGFNVLPCENDEQMIARMAKDIGATLVHCDDYTAASTLHDVLRETGIRLSNIEDGSFGARPADVIVDPSLGAERLYRSGASSATHLRGIAYIPLRSIVLEAAAARRSRQAEPEPTREKHIKVLVVLGGTDAAGATKHLVHLWSSTIPNSTCYAVVPAAVPSSSQPPLGPGKVHWLSTSENVVSLFSEVDVVVSAAGTTVWELAAVGVPTAVVMQADNQRENYNQLVGSGSMVGLGPVSDIGSSAEPIREKFKKLVEQTGSVSTPPHGIDLEGARRIVTSWTENNSLFNGIRMRAAQISDASILFDWRNHETVRKVSVDTGPLQWDTHLAWLRSVLGDPERILLIAQLASDSIGTVRFDRAGNDKAHWQLSIALNPLFRGRGLGDQVLQAAETHLRKHLQDEVAIVTALVKVDNAPSNNLFARNGYERDTVTRSLECWCWRKRLT